MNKASIYVSAFMDIPVNVPFNAIPDLYELREMDMRTKEGRERKEKYDKFCQAMDTLSELAFECGYGSVKELFV